MAAETGTVWAIDIGNNSLKGLYLSTERGVVEVIGFENIRHGKILSGGDVTDAEREELIALSLRKFVNKYDLSMDEIIISVPSQNSFARFVTLPPVEEKRIPEMVKFEAVQQIPFGIDDVQWDWQMMTEPDSPEIKVGIFAIKNEVVNSALEHFNREDVQVSYVQMSPMALYNYLLHDRPDLVTSDSQATVVLNVGAENTDLVVCTKSSVWQRCILIGGNAFTKAIADAFRLNFEKAEKLKRTAPVSKYARQIFQAMRPVFTDLASEVQRSLNFYNSSEPDTKITKMVALGGGTKLRGLLKYLQQTLQIPVERPDVFKRLRIGPGVSPAKFHENVSDFGVIYGLALQGLGLARIDINLLPRNIARSMAWAGKGKYFIAAACMLLVVSLLCFGRTGLDRMNYSKNSGIRTRIGSILRKAEGAKEQFEQQEDEGRKYNVKIEKQFGLFKYREVVPFLSETIISALPNEKNNPEQAELYKAFAKGEVEKVLKFPRNNRKQIFITDMSINFTKDLSSAEFGSTDLWSRNQGLPDAELESQMSFDSRRTVMPTTMQAQQAEEKKIGFVVQIIGYSPYGRSVNEFGKLLDPHGVEDDWSKWGFVTRLEHIDDIIDGNCPFELYERNDPEHFSLEMKEVTFGGEISPGIGEEAVRYKTTAIEPGEDAEKETVLKDPMTKEIISTIAVWDEYGRQKLGPGGEPLFKVNDHWFILNFKLLWKGGPEFPKQQVTSSSSRRSIMM
jgi:type IV pilus assembly protein PilM